MLKRWLKIRYGLLAAPLLVGVTALWAQTPPLPTQPAPLPTEPAPLNTTAPAQPNPDDQKGVDVQTRGPIHEAFASLAAEPVPTKAVPKLPPPPIEEMPPADKPEGDVIWIKGYWAWDEDRNDYLWVSGVWRQPPPGKEWVPGYWRQDTNQAQWVPGFWTGASKENGKQDVTYLPEPPKPPQAAPPGQPPAADTFYVPGHWVWNAERGAYMWQAGYWAKVQPDYVWVAGHYRWTPSGYIYIPGYWDLAVAKRGVMYAPVVIDPAVVRVGFVYTPAYAIHDTIVVDTLWVRPAYCHYYFGDYYGPVYRDRGFEGCVVYSQRNYDCIIVYERWDHRRDPAWFDVQVRLYNDRFIHPEARPPRTLVEVRLGGDRVAFKMVAPAREVIAARGGRVVHVDEAARVRAMKQAEAVHAAAAHRVEEERRMPVGAPAKPRVASLATQPSPARTTTTTTTTRTTTTTTTPGHTVGTPPSSGHAVGTPPSSGITQPGTTTTHSTTTTTTTPGKQPLLPGHQPPAKDKEKEKDKDKDKHSGN